MMSHRGKRQALSRSDDITSVATKRRKGRASATTEEEDAPALEQQRASYSDMKISSIYNRSVTEAPAELFRKDLISAMKLPDSEPLTSEKYWVITDQWKQEWERGVQVPVKPDSLPGPVVSIASSRVNSSRKMHHEYKLPKNKYIRITKDEHFRVDEHYLSNVGIQAKKCCAYDLEDVDVVWLNILNGERALLGLKPVNQDQLERVIEELEMRCWEKVHAIVKKEEGLALEFDESVICDVCRSPDSEDGNEMVFCDCCNICVHQACYGITTIPSGSWLCRTCVLGLRPECVLCPNKNGAMKSTRTGQKWAHVSCALWIPEVSIGCVEKMEPITKISSIPQSRWALICVLCRERVGACIQCSVKTCKTAYHVTCAFKHGLEMRAIIDEDSNTDDDNTVKLRSYCQKHSVSSKKETICPPTGSDEEVKKVHRKDMTTEEKTHARAVKLQEIEAEFEKHVNVKDITRKYDVDVEGLEFIYNYWVLKRRASFNKPLLAARSEDASDLQNKNQEAVDQEKMRMFVQLRQDLERVRNLCYMVSRREKLSRTYQKLREQTFYKQAAILSDTKAGLSTAEITAIKDANHGPSIYDRLYSYPNAPDLSTDFETMVHRIAGQSDPELSPQYAVNGFIFSSSKKDRKRFNGDIYKDYESLSSSYSDIDSKSHVGVETESDTHGKVNNRMNKSQRKNNVENRIKNTARRRKKTSPASYLGSTSSSEQEDGVDISNSSKLAQRSKKNSSSSKKQSSVTRPFCLLERLGSRSDSISTGDDTEDDLFMLRKPPKSESKKSDISKIYTSDSDSSSEKDVSSSASHKQVRTKASVKEFIGSGGSNRSSKESGRSNSVSKLTTFSSTKGSAAPDRHKKRVDDLFDEDSDDNRTSVGENKVFDKAAKTGTEVVSKNKKSKSDSVKGEKEKKRPLHGKNLSKELMKVFNDNGNYLDTLTLVPQRAAAKKAIKAIEHIKNGMVKPVANFDEVEMDELFKSNLKPSKTLKKEQQNSLSLKQKSTDAKETKPDPKSTTIDKRTPPRSASSSFTPSHSISGPAITAPLTPSATTMSSQSNLSSTSRVATATAVKPTVSSDSKKNASSSSSGSSSGSSTSGSSFSSSSSSSSSDSSSSGSSSSSSSSSSESEAENAPSNFTKKNLPSSKAGSETAAAKTTSVSASVHKPMPECEKRELDLMNEKSSHTGSANDISVANKEIKSQVSSEKVNLDDKPKSPVAIAKQPENEDYLTIDKSTLLETKTAIEHLTTGEQNFMLPSAYWDTTNTAKDENKIGNDNDDDKKSCRSRSLFSPIKDFDLSSFDDDMNENNNLADGSFSLASLSLFSSDLTYKEDTKEDSVRETLNLVEKLKLQMARNKGNHTNENADTADTPNIPDGDDLKDESFDSKVDTCTVKSDESTASESSQHVYSTSNGNIMTPTDNHTTIPLELHPSVDIFNSTSIAPTKQEPSANNEPIVISELATQNSSWPQSAQRYNESSSPYIHDMMHPADRWSESVMMPSRRSDCSSVSLSSSSSSSSAYSEHHQVNSDDVSRVDSVPTLEMRHKSVTDLLRPPEVGRNDMAENMYAYSNFNSTSPMTMTDKPLFPHAPQQINQQSSLFSTPMFDPMSAYTNTDQLMGKPYGQPLSIQTPCAATASFTTTSQNMAMITSIISPMPPPSSEEVPAIPVIGTESVSFEEKIPKVLPEQTNFTATPSAENVQLKPKEVYFEGVEKENNRQPAPLSPTTTTMTGNLIDVNTILVEAGRPLAEKNDNENKTDSVKVPAEESSSVTSLLSNDSSTATTPVATPQPKTSQMTSSKKSPVKPLRVSARVMSQNKSPVAKSPVSGGISPARPETLPTTGKSKSREAGTRKNNRANRTPANRRGRGRGRGRNQLSNCFYRDWEGDTITEKLVGTVYDFDFDDDAATPSDNFENLRAMRERRKSTDTPYADRLSTSSKDTCYSPKFASPSSQMQISKRKGSVASTPDRRTAHRTQLSPLCEIGNNSRIIQNDLYRDNLAPAEDDEEEEDDQVEDEEVDEEEGAFISSGKISTAVCGKSYRKRSLTSPTLPQPPVQSSSLEHFAAVQPVLPGPVDMRTYSGSMAVATSSPAFNRSINTNADNFLESTFPAATDSSCVEPVPDIVDVLEKEIQKYSRSQKSSPAVSSPRVCNDATKLGADTHSRSSPNDFAVGDHSELQTTASLIDDETTTFPARNQLKFKIKGPYSDANYAHFTTTTNSSISSQQLPSVSNSISGISVTDGFSSAVSFANTNVSSASSSNLRRMRKKELLEQYKAQGVLDESGNDIAAVLPNSGMAGELHPGTTSNMPVKSGPTYKLPKAVASMTTIPTKEDYKAVLDAAYIEKKKRGKDKSSSVGLNASDISNNNINNSNYRSHNIYNNKLPNNLVVKSPDRKAFTNSAGDVNEEYMNDNHGSRRRSRNTASSSSAPPKLKIKIGSGATSSVVLDNSVCSVTSSEEKNLRLRPPKKRLCDQTDMQPLAPAVEQLKRECMRYRSQVISEFNENGETGTYDDFSDNKNRGSSTTTRPTSKHSDVPSKKRKKRSSSTSKSSKRKKKQQRANDAGAEDDESGIGPLVSVINVDSGCAGAPKKLIIKFFRSNQGLEPAATAVVPPPKSSKSSKHNSNLETPSAPSPSPQPIPTKPSKSSKRNTNNELDSVRTDKITPIRLKIKRSKEGYVSKSEVPTADNVPAEKAAPVAMLPEAPVVVAETTTTATVISVDEAAPPTTAISTEAQMSAVSTS